MGFFNGNECFSHCFPVYMYETTKFTLNSTAILHKSNPVKEDHHQTQTKDKSTTGKLYQFINNFCTIFSYSNYKITFALLQQGLLSEVEVKYKMSQCYLHLKEYKEATTIVCEVVFFLF